MCHFILCFVVYLFISTPGMSTEPNDENKTYKTWRFPTYTTTKADPKSYGYGTVGEDYIRKMTSEKPSSLASLRDRKANEDSRVLPLPAKPYDNQKHKSLDDLRELLPKPIIQDQKIEVLKVPLVTEIEFAAPDDLPDDVKEVTLPRIQGSVTEGPVKKKKKRKRDRRKKSNTFSTESATYDLVTSIHQTNCQTSLKLEGYTFKGSDFLYLARSIKPRRKRGQTIWQLKQLDFRGAHFFKNTEETLIKFLDQQKGLTLVNLSKNNLDLKIFFKLAKKDFSRREQSLQIAIGRSNLKKFGRQARALKNKNIFAKK